MINVMGSDSPKVLFLIHLITSYSIGLYSFFNPICYRYPIVITLFLIYLFFFIDKTCLCGSDSNLSVTPYWFFSFASPLDLLSTF